MAKTNLKQTEEITKRKELRIGIANLVLTGISMLITAAIGIYLANRNEVLQQKMIEWKAESELAKIHIQTDVNRDAPYFYVFGIKNNGLSAAKNLNIEICLRGPVYMWNSFISEAVIKDIGQFDIFIDNSSLTFQKQNRKSTCSFNENINNNSTVLTVENLPPSERLLIGIKLTDELLSSANTGNYDGRVYFIVPTNIPIKLQIDPNSLEYPLNQSLQTFLINNYQIAFFTLNASCDNCSIENNGATAAKTSLANYHTSNIEIISNNQNYTKFFVDLKAEYLVPQNTSASSSGIFYLQGFENLNGIPILSEISYDEFKSK